ncbi:MAG: polyphosphate kinase 1 [Saprospiraceae bacterium]
MGAPKFHKRDISWLSFNHRVLQEAADPKVPLYERIKFLAIYSSNLDEFYRVRVAALRRFKELNKADRKEFLDIKPKQELNTIKTIVHQQQIEFGRIFREEIIPALKAHQIFLINDLNQFSADQKVFAKQFFKEKILPLTKTQYLKENQAPPFLENRAVYLLTTFKDNSQLGIVNLPSDTLGRFVVLPSQNSKHNIAFLDDIIRLNMQRLFPEEINQIFSIKVSRDAELYIDDEFSGDLLEKIKSSLGKRDTGLPTRMLFDSKMHIELTTRLKQMFQLKKNDLFPGGRYHNFSDFFSFPKVLDLPQLSDPEMPPLPHPVLDSSENLIQTIQEKDQLLHFPYQRYHYVPDLIQEAADHPDITKIKITLYRVASKSTVVQALLYALKQGKEVVAFIEAKARFDEASNIYWGKELEEAGATVLYSYPAIKVHTKLLYFEFSKGTTLKNFAYLGTGNFNEKTARLYGDHALITTNRKIVKDVEQVFGILERKILIPKTKKLLVSPFDSRSGFEALIQREIQNAKNGEKAYMVLKMNSLEDPTMIEQLYRANNAGVDITLIIRGICCLVPGIAGQSEHIKVYSLVDRFLEHARVYIFGNKGQEELFIASADWMTRNLDRRIEVVIPVTSQQLAQEIRHIINLQLEDNSKLRWINSSLDNPYIEKEKSEKSRNAQTAIYAYLASLNTV